MLERAGYVFSNPNQDVSPGPWRSGKILIERQTVSEGTCSDPSYVVC